MGNGIPSEFFIHNRLRLRELFTGTAPIVIAANGQMQRGGDCAYQFSQDASFWYLTGIDDPDLVLVLDRDREYLIVPGRSHTRELFDGEIVEDKLTKRSGINEVVSEKEGWDKLGTRLKKVKHAATIAPSPAYVEQYGMYTNPARASLVAKMKAENDAIELLDLSGHISRMRMIKQPAELVLLQKAIDITCASIKDATKLQKLKAYGYEYELEAAIVAGFRKRGAETQGFDPIVAGGGRACQIHYLANNHPLAAGELVIMDVSAEVSHYAADVARTVSIGMPSRRQQTVVAAVQEVHEYASGLLKPGVLLKEYEAEVEQFMGEKLRELGLIKSISSESVRQFFPHRTSHFLGLNAHDAGDYDRPLEAGTVLTVEPGIYIPKEETGVRIEDDVIITETGIKNLSNKLPNVL